MRIFLLLALSFTAGAQEYTLKGVIDNLIRVESDGRNHVISDNGKAVGCLQVHPIMIAECNRILKRKEFVLADRTSRARSRYMATVFLAYQISRYKKHFGKMPSEYTLASSWNTGSIFNQQNRKYIVRYKLKKEI